MIFGPTSHVGHGNEISWAQTSSCPPSAINWPTKHAPPLFTLFPQGGMNSSLSGHFSWATCKKVIKKRTFSDIIKNHFSTNLVEIHHFEQTCKKKLPKMTLMGYKNGSGGTNFPSELFPLDAFARGGGAETASDDFRGGIWSIIYIGQDDVADHVTTLQAFDQKPDKCHSSLQGLSLCCGSRNSRKKCTADALHRKPHFLILKNTRIQFRCHFWCVLFLQFSTPNARIGPNRVSGVLDEQ